MTDNEITREKTFSEELPYFKEQMQEVFDNYHNPNGSEDPLYIAVLRHSSRIVRKAEEEVTHQQAEIERLNKVYQANQQLINALNKSYFLAKVDAYKECLAKVKNYIKTHCNPYGKPDFDYDTSIKILNFIDKLAKEMVGDDSGQSN